MFGGTAAYRATGRNFCQLYRQTDDALQKNGKKDFPVPKKGPKPLGSDDACLPEGVVPLVGRVGFLVADDDVIQEVNPDDLGSLPQSTGDRQVSGRRRRIT